MLGVAVGAAVGGEVGEAVGITGVGAGVEVGMTDAAGASVTPMAVSAYEGQYDSLPSKAAVTVYSPGTGGVHSRLNKPLLPLVA